MKRSAKLSVLVLVPVCAVSVTALAQMHHAPTAAQCQADETVWHRTLSQVDMEDQGSLKGVSYDTLGEVLVEMNECGEVDPARGGAYFSVLAGALDARLLRVMDFVNRHHLGEQFKKEDLAGIRGDKPESSDSAPRVGPSASNTQTITTFRGHILGESWHEFIRTERGLCQSKSNAENCLQAADGKEANLWQIEKGGSVLFNFEYGRFAQATFNMSGPSFAELTYFERTYGKPRSKFSLPQKGTAKSSWYFDDGGEAHATETEVKSDKFTIEFMIQASDYAMRPGSLAANSYTPIFDGHSLGESWEKFVRTGGGLCQLDEGNAKHCKDAAAGKYATLVGQSVDGHVGPSFTFWDGHLMEASFSTSVSKFEELDDLDKTYGHSYYMTSSPENGFATARWDYADGGQISATEAFVAPDGIIEIYAKTVIPH